MGTGGDLSVRKVNFTNGYGISAFGGAIDAEHGAAITGATFTGNSAGYYGGAVSGLQPRAGREGGGIHNAGTVNLTNTTVRFNTVNNCSPNASVTGCTG